jgi:hypothetical protein
MGVTRLRFVPARRRFDRTQRAGGNPNNRGGVRVATSNFDNDTQAELVVGDGANAGSHVTAYLGKNIAANGTPPVAFEFDAFPGV